VVSKPKNEFTERALVRLSEIYIKLKNTNGAISILKKLELLADLSQNISFAQANLMKLFYETNDFENAEKYADEVLLNPKNTDNVKNDAQIIVARSAIKTNSEAKAKTAYAALQKTAKGELASEALFYDAYFKNKENLFEQSNVVIQKLSKNYGSYKYFAAKSLVVMAKNFYGLKDSFQANFILESVIKNFSQFADIIADAKSEQSKILSEEGKTNSSIQK
jgi:tetratricopeptide (TPR) repeat protein